MGYLIFGISDMIWSVYNYSNVFANQIWLAFTIHILVAFSTMFSSFGLLKMVPNLGDFLKKNFTGALFLTVLILTMIGVVAWESLKANIFDYPDLIEFIAIPSTFVLMLVSSMLMIGAMSLHWSIVGCSLFNFAVGIISIRVDKIIYQRFHFDIYSVLVLTGVSLSLLRLYCNTDDSFYSAKYEARKSIYVSYKTSTILILFFMLLLFFLLQKSDVDGRRAIISISCLTAYAVMFVNKYLANNIVSNSAKLTELISCRNVGSAIMDSDIPFEVRTYYTGIIEASMREKRVAADYKAKSRLAHDISSPIEVLCSVLDGKEVLSEGDVALLKKSTENMKDMLKVTRNWKNQFYKSTYEESISLNSLISSVISHKSIEFRKRKIDFSFVDHCKESIFVNCSEFILFSIFSNLLNHSIESFGQGKGAIVLNLNYKNNRCGIKLTESVSVHGDSINESQQGGSLSHIKATLEKMGGTLEHTSDSKALTTTVISLPLCQPPSWYLPYLEFDARGRVIVIDDSREQHVFVQKLLEPFKIKSVHFHDYEEFRDMLPMLSSKDKVLVDYQVGSELTGIEIIERHSLMDRAVLVTSYADEHLIRKYCSEAGIRMIPKEMLGKIKIFVHRNADQANSSQFDAVVVDDQQMILEYCQQKASEANLNIKCFAQVEDLYSEAANIHKDTLVYVDYNLNDGISGLDVTRSLKEIYGFQQVYLTSVDDIPVHTHSWIDGFIKKRDLIFSIGNKKLPSLKI